MAVLLKLTAFFAGVVCLGALGAPLLYDLGQFGASFEPLSFLKDMPFSRYFNRSIMLAAFFGIVPFVRWFGLRKLRDIGHFPHPHARRDLMVGFWQGFTVVALGGVLLVLGGSHEWRGTFSVLVVLGAFFTAWLVATLEEFFFRGALVTIVSRATGLLVATIFVSMLYSVVHFLRIRGGGGPDLESGMWAGFKLLPKAFVHFKAGGMIWLGCLNLFLLGLLLCWTSFRSKALFWAIGIHAGIIFAFKTFKHLTKRVGEANIWATKPILYGVGTLCVVLFLIGVVVLWSYYQSRREAH